MFWLFLAPRCFQSRPKHFTVCFSLCTLDLPYYTGMDTFQQQRLKPFQLLNLFSSSFYFFTAHIHTHTHTHTHTHMQHFQNMHKIFVYLPIILLDLRHLFNAFSLMSNNPFNFAAKMSGIISKLFDIIPLNNRFEIKAIISKADMASIPTKGNSFNPAKN